MDQLIEIGWITAQYISLCHSITQLDGNDIYIIGGLGIVISYDGLANQIILKETVTTFNGTSTTVTEYKDNSLNNSNSFGIYLGAVLAFGGSIIGLLYKAKTAGGEDT